MLGRTFEGTGSSPGEDEPRSPSEMAAECLELGQYHKLVELFDPDERGADLGRTGSSLKRQVRDVVLRICQASSEDRDEAALLREALDRIEVREEELKHTLGAILHLVDEAAWQPPRAGPKPQTIGGAERDASSPAIEVYCLGTFEVYFGGRLVENWTGGKGKAILKFLAASPGHRAGKEMLMELLWPDAEPHAARNSLNVAVYGLRQAFSRIDPHSVVLFRGDAYLLNPELEIWFDHEAFIEHLMTAQAQERSGHVGSAMHEYRRAESLYRGEFLGEDRYDDWPDGLRRRLRDQYVMLLDRLGSHAFDRRDYGTCVEIYRKMSAIDPYDEEPYRRLMVCWSRLGLAHLALRQYAECQDALAQQLEVAPSPTTNELFRRIQQGEPV